MPEERKLVTILFADVTGSTALGESLDPEDVRALMGRYYEHARRVIADYGGTIEKFIGDAVMAIFGLSQAHDDDTERALAATLALRTAISKDEILGEDFQLRMGVNTGEVVATSDHSGGDFLITGDAVNVAARLQQNAQPGEIVVSERAVNSARNAFTFGEVREIQAKGKKLPLRIFPLQGFQEKRKVERPPFVGRKADLTQLTLLKDRVLEEERPQLVSIVAPAGTGKTRLLEEFLDRIDEEEGFQTAMVRCLPYGQTLTYWPLRGLLNGLLIGEEVNKQTIQAIFTQGGYTQDDAVRLANLILATLGIDGSEGGTTDRESIFTAWRLLIEVFARQAPRILIFEDLHWASDSMLDLVEHITHVRTHACVYVIVLSRPELLDRRPIWGGGLQNFTSISLQPLSTKLTQDLIQRIMTDLPSATKQQVAERSGGNPFFALEMVRGLKEIAASGEGSEKNTLPDTVHAAVQARMDLLSRQERAILQVSAVASRGIRTPMLRAVLEDYSLHEIDSAIDGLLQRDMLVPAEGDSFAFRHILIRDVSYGTLSRSERIRIHSKIADWLASSTGEQADQFAEIIAYHYREAVLLSKQAAVPKPMPRETQQAVYFLTKAGEKASRGGAFSEATNYFQNAIKLATPTQQTELNEKLADSVVWGETVFDAYSKAIELWQQTPEKDVQLGARLARKRYMTYSRYPTGKRFDAEERRKLWEETLQLVQEAGDEEGTSLIHAFRYNLTEDADSIVQEAEQSLEECHKALRLFEERQSWEYANYVIDRMSGLSWIVNKHQDALELSQRRLTLPNLPLNERYDIYGTIIATHLLFGQYEQCIAVTLDVLHNLRAGEPVEYLAMALNSAMWAAYINGQWDVADTLMKPLQEIWERLQNRPGTTHIVQGTYLVSFLIALAREDRPALDASTSILERSAPDMKESLPSFREDNFEPLVKNIDKSDTRGILLLLTNEHELFVPDAWLTNAQFQEDILKWTSSIARALQANDIPQLAKAIDDAEQHGLIVHAARMRIILARRSRDRRYLELARPVLERLNDRLSLRKLAEVAAELA